ncbi:MAG: tRNA uridine-5-carboxymethylaminomethyl(34) synthesis enzyme MnmG [Acutalibacteraceae bacterium]|nr:tRNA uridine-5-carboxymethylaminomethyl(34) synthesis enzyme MnmG [Acutalibacteraceae bacterium]
MAYFAGNIDVAVIGAGHAGIEAALAASRLNLNTIIFTINLDSVGNLPCNPAIGGTAKGHLVRELDALGGEMGKAADETFIQSRMLNKGKGPAVHSLRAQIDRRHYSERMKHCLEKQENLTLIQAEITAIEQDGEVWKIYTRMDACYTAKAVIICTGTYLGGKVYIGEVNYESGPDGLFPAAFLGESLRKLGVKTRRFKTGTPPRVLRSSIDFSELEEQYGDNPITPFSYDTDPKTLTNKAICHITWTNEKTKEIILNNLHRSPLYAGEIEGVGPRYCPSIEDKTVRFKDKQRHQIFIEPCGLNTEEMYLQGVSSSLPEEVQQQMYHSIKGLENCKIMRTAYAIEYDCIDPTALYATLEFKDFSGLYGAGQFNGSSGYEEAAVQGFVAGVNAARKIKGESPLILSRADSYIGTLIDDLVTKGCNEPYRMMTSRSEYRLVLRQDNADERLMAIGREIGLINDKKWEDFEQRQTLKQKEIERANSVVFPPNDELNKILESNNTAPATTGIRLCDLIKRPQLDYEKLTEIDKTRPDIPNDVLLSAQTEIKYDGYIKRQNSAIKELKRLENKSLPENIDYNSILGLRLEAREKLSKIRPKNIGQASRVSGVSPADVSVLLIWLEKGNSK